MTREKLIESVKMLKGAQPTSTTLYASPNCILALLKLFSDVLTEPNVTGLSDQFQGLVLRPMYNSPDRYLYLSNGDEYTGLIDLGEEWPNA